MARAEPIPAREAGARNSKSDQAIIQTIHDHAAALGACCGDDDEMTESARLAERDISKEQRDEADDSDFAGKGKSFPILKAEDVKAALSSIGRAGADNYSSDKLKANILRIAKRKGFPIPESDQKESAVSTDVNLVESAATLEPIVIREARADYEIKLIAPGKGSSAFYPAEVLKRDGPKVFKAGTHVYVNHPTMAEEAQRPEGDVKNLAGVLTTDAVYHEAHAKGPGLYGRMKVFADHGQMVEEKAAHVGMSIRAAGIAEASRKHEGLPVLKELTRAESVDVVTKAGAGGMILTEATKPGIPMQEAGMTAEETQRLIEAAVAPFKARAIQGDARSEATRLLETITLPQVAKNRIIERAIANPATTATGELDLDKLRECVVAESKAEGEYLAAITGGGRIQGMGISAPAAPAKPEDFATREAREAREIADEISIYESLGMSKRGAEFAAKGRAA